MNAQRPEATGSPIFSRCCLNTTRCSMELAVPFCDGRSYRDRNLRSELLKSVIEAIERFLKDRARRGNVEAQPGFAAGPKLFTGACENACPILDPCRDVAGRQSGAGEIDPCEIGRIESHRARARRGALDPVVEDIATAGE